MTTPRHHTNDDDDDYDERLTVAKWKEDEYHQQCSERNQRTLFLETLHQLRNDLLVHIESNNWMFTQKQGQKSFDDIPKPTNYAHYNHHPQKQPPK